MQNKSEKRNCQNCKKDFIVESEDFSFYEKIKVPPPTFCPLCRVERRMAYGNERKLFKAKDFFTGNEIFSLYPPESNKKVSLEKEWFKDNWNDLASGVDYDFSKNFFEQFFKLEKDAPVFCQRTQFMINSPYCANASGLKNCYLCFNSNYSENSMYGNATDQSKDCVDNSHISHSERCYESFWCQNCYQCYFTTMSSDSRNLWFCRNCISCNDCFGCVNLRNASYQIFNKQYTKEEYQEKIEKFHLYTISGLKKIREVARSFWNTQPVKYHQGIKNLNSYGSYVTNSKNVKDSYLIREGENIKYSQYLQVPKNKDCYDATTWGENMEMHYETCISGGNTYNLKFCIDCWPNSKNLEYCLSTFSSSDCFGCIGLKKRQYCIFNKQYTKEEYYKMVEKIKKHMNDFPYVDEKGRIYKYGEFFPIKFSPFGYNNSRAVQFFNMTKEKAKENGYPWIEVKKGEYKITKKASELSDSITDVDESIIKEVIECEKCKRPYRILADEFVFYKRENLPLPVICNDCRFERRIADRMKIELFERRCMCGGKKDINGKYINTVKHDHGESSCPEIFKTGYNPESNNIVYCESCYQKEVY